MSFTYDPSLSTTLDRVRFYCQDVVEAGAMLSDEEITGVISAQTATGSALPYYAAAECLQTLHTRWMTAGKGKVSKKVSRLTVVYGSGAGINVDAAIALRISDLRKRGAFLLSPRPYALRVL